MNIDDRPTVRPTDRPTDRPTSGPIHTRVIMLA